MKTNDLHTSRYPYNNGDMFFKEILECDNDADVVEIVERIDEIDWMFYG